MELERYMFDEAFEFHDPSCEKDKHRSSYSSPPQNERWPPLGAASTDETTNACTASPTGEDESKHVAELEREQEKLNSSLMALTSHFAQVQFRLKQIVSAPKSEQEKLLRELEDFAFIGCPEAVGPDNSKVQCVSCATHVAYECYDKRIASQKERQKNLAEQLKMLLEELEKYATKAQLLQLITTRLNENPVDGMLLSRKQKDAKTNLFEERTPPSKSDKSRFLVEQLRSKLNMTPEEFESMSPEEMKNQIDKAMAKLVNPGKAKEHLIAQLSNQIQDMENFVEFLKDNEQISNDNGKTKLENDSQNTGRFSRERLKSNNSSSKSASPVTIRKKQNDSSIPAPHTKILEISEEKRKRLHEASMAVIKKALAVLQIFAISQFGCSAKHFEEHMMRKAAATAASAGFQKALNTLKSSVDRIISLHNELDDLGLLLPDYDEEVDPPENGKVWPRSRMSSHASASRSRSTSIGSCISEAVLESDKQLEKKLKDELIAAVRGELAPSLRDLIQHGLCRSVENSVLSTKSLLGCISDKSTRIGTMHAWELLSEFYKMKHGNQFNNQPNVKLSESFGVDLGGTQETPRQSLLTAMHKIKTSHEPRKRSYDSMFRALVCAGMNRQKLLLWVRLIVRCPELIDKHYERWSYLARTGFDEVLAALDKLSSLNFYLPENLAIRHLVKSYNEFGDPC